MTDTSADTIVRQSSGERVSAVVRTWNGVFDVDRFGTTWVCSCGGAPACVHVERVRQHLLDRQNGTR